MKAIHNALYIVNCRFVAVFKEQSYDSFSSPPVLPPLLPVVVDDEPQQADQTDNGTLEKHLRMF